MSDNDAIFEALAVIEKHCRDMEARMTRVEAALMDHHARLTAHGLLIEQLRRAPGVPSLHPVWRKEAA